jgi:predicted RNA-binding Zn-ribbon protein involved in translation (DUF1610 family)
VILLVLVVSTLGLFGLQGSRTIRLNSSSSTMRIRTAPLAPVYQYLSYDEQVGTTFAQNSTRLAFNVTAVAQKDSATGIGPAYLVNGLTNTGYWYQVGLSYDWPQPSGAPLPGFYMSYEVFSPLTLYTCEGSIFPTNCGIGTGTIRVNSNDTVQLSLGFSGGNVTMKTRDWNTNSTASASFTAEGGTYFVGLLNQVSDTNGFFTGLMTEQYYASPFTGSGQPVTYRQAGSNITAAMMWLDEFDTNTFLPVFSDQTPSSLTLANSTLLQYFSSHGTAEAANGTELVTGLTPIILPSLTSSISATYRPGQQASIVLGVSNPSALTIKITSLKVSTEFGIFDVTSSAQSSFSTDSIFNTNILLPSKLVNGTYTVTVVAVLQFLDSQTPGWFAAQPIYSSSTLTVIGPSVVPSITTTISGLLLTLSGILLPSILAMMAAGVVAGSVTIVVIRREVPHAIDHSPMQQVCQSCGETVEQTMAFCPNCGTGLFLRASQLGPEGQTIQPGQPPG